MRNYQKDELMSRNKQAIVYEKWYIENKGLLFDKLEKRIFKNNIKKNKTILDLWCWTWRITENINNYSKKIVSVDFSENSINILKSKKLNNVTAEVVDITKKLPYDNWYYDYILSCQVIQHLQLDDLVKVLNEISRILKNDWVFIFSVYNLDCIFFWNVFEELLDNGLYIKRFNYSYIKYLAKISWFKIKKIEYYWVNPILHKSNSKINLLFEYLLKKIPFINKKLWKYVFVILEKNDNSKN